MGKYYEIVEKKYDLAKKYYLLAIDKGNIEAMLHLGWCYYAYDEKNYNLTVKYYLMAIDKDCISAMDHLGWYYGYVEKKYDLAKEYWLTAADKGCVDAINSLAWYYQLNERNYDLAKKYFFRAIEKGCQGTFDYFRGDNLCSILGNIKLNKEDLQNYLMAVINGDFRFEECSIFCDYEYNCKEEIDYYEHQIINLFCSNIFVINNLNIEDFGFCILKIICYINNTDDTRNFNDVDCVANNNDNNNILLEDQLKKKHKSKKIEYFMKCISRLYYCTNKKKQKRKKCVREILRLYMSQLFMEYLDLHYYKYLKKIYAPDGKGYIKTKKHFELIAKQNNKQNKLNK